jgi:hypothetical protein
VPPQAGPHDLDLGILAQVFGTATSYFGVTVCAWAVSGRTVSTTPDAQGRTARATRATAITVRTSLV